MTKFVVVTQGRSGSTLLCNLLDLHPDIRCYQELYLEPNRAMGTAEVNRLNRAYQRMEYRNYKGGHVVCDEMVEYLDSVYSSFEGLATGFKTPYSIAGKLRAMEYLFGGDVKVIRINRRNILRKLISLEFAMHTKKWHRYSWSRAWPDDFKITLNTTVLQARLGRIMATRNGFNRLLIGRQIHEVWYEDFVEDIPGTVMGVTRFIGVPDHEVGESKLRKSLRGDWREHVHNHEEVEKTLKGTIYDKFL